eukprot:COSAG01_NODE_8992_length_2589_cov_3.432530_2_plen_51_part_00
MLEQAVSRGYLLQNIKLRVAHENKLVNVLENIARGATLRVAHRDHLSPAM